MYSRINVFFRFDYDFNCEIFLLLFQDPRVLDAMMPYMTQSYGNPHSRTHMYGWESEEAVETARQVFHFQYNFN